MIAEYPEQLKQSKLFKNFTIKDFNAKLNVDEVAKIDMDATALSVGELLKKHDLLDLLGVCNVHNHFHLNENEIVLAKFNPGLSKSDQKGFDIESTSANYVYLKATRLDKSIHAVPYIFDASNQKMVDRFYKLVERSENLISFYHEFNQLAQKGVEDVLGIYLLYDDFFERKPNSEIIEITNVESREQLIYTGPADQLGKPVITQWAFSTDNEGIIKVYCLQMCDYDSEKMFHNRSHHKLYD